MDEVLTPSKYMKAVHADPWFFCQRLDLLERRTTCKFLGTGQTIIAIDIKRYGVVFNLISLPLKQMFVPYYLFPTCVRSCDGFPFDISPFFDLYAASPMPEA